jgi:hypothetical protein
MHHTKREGKDKAKDLTKSHHVDARKKKIEETSDCRQFQTHARMRLKKRLVLAAFETVRAEKAA